MLCGTTNPDMVNAGTVLTQSSRLRMAPSRCSAPQRAARVIAPTPLAPSAAAEPPRAGRRRAVACPSITRVSR